ncbi:copper homeostasis protein CutC [Bacillus sp. REN3]|uniref:copper homeostasis protein CutC n=1 Tax=Bacillus sp. REN3 TaxID=2802440 RepID=UPI001AEDC152|nr:copper homeostasis protein CutC [Bacillus sp. REN3]
MLIEIIATTIEDAILIEQSGADRIELVSALSEGGITPSYSLIESVVNKVKIPVNVMIRPHSQSFCYSNDDLSIMKNDLKVVRSLGANGVVLGVLNDRNEVDLKSVEELLEESSNLEVTFHRAVDRAEDPIEAIKVLSRYKEIKTVLTSGGMGELTDRLNNIKGMKEVCGHLELLVGSGLNRENISTIHSTVNTGHYHFGTSVRKNSSPIEGIDQEELKKLVELMKEEGSG